MPHQNLPLDPSLAFLQALAEGALGKWDIPPDATLTLINVSENVTFLVGGASTFQAVLRVHRAGYHSLRAIECELAWIDALNTTKTIPPHRPILGRDGRNVQFAQSAPNEDPRMMVLFEYIDGVAPSETDDLREGFHDLGALAARCHNHVSQWQKPAPFERLTWDLNTVFGPNATWGDWRDAPNVDTHVRRVLDQVEAKIKARLMAYGKAPDRFNLIHADMRLANVLITPHATHLIDFDDCGFGWFMYDFAAAVSFIEDDPNLPALKAAWLEGYQQHRRLSAADLAEIDTMVMLRRMALLAWIGSHSEAPEPTALAPDFARVTAELGQAYLDQP